ncbi:MAG: hypothetical protein CVT49_05935 [candidate division Zixibacteria bacterium HGW-Zixibacteria-1]|nr:MAG: hypothetical protein CVT49_05935 [candidate division Zixibacteria bacterium HGW-Zixibacteria-1]
MDTRSEEKEFILQILLFESVAFLGPGGSRRREQLKIRIPRGKLTQRSHLNMNLFVNETKQE